MSYDTDIYNRYYTECDYFSTPLKTFQGVAVGDAAEGDNARAINIMAPIVANYRKAVLPTVADPKFSPADNTLFRNTLSYHLHHNRRYSYFLHCKWLITYSEQHSL